jgi:hypothetical protein
MSVSPALPDSPNHEGFYEMEPLSDPIEETPTPQEEGKGPGMLGKMWSVAATASNYVKGLLVSNPVVAVEGGLDPSFIDMLERLNNRGRMLNNIDMTLFFQGLNNKLKKEGRLPFSYSLNFLNATISHTKLDEATVLIEKMNPQQTMVIPFVLSGDSRLEINHITVLMIKEGVVSYYDSKGVISDYRPIEEDTLRAVIDFCRDKWASQAEIKQNVTTHQWDINTCGLRVAQFIYNRVWNGRSLDDFSDEGDLDTFRQTFFDTALFAFKL